MRENRPYGSEGGEQRYCSPTPIGICAHGAPRFCLDPGLRRDDNVVECRQTQSARLFAILRANRCVRDFPGQQWTEAGVQAYARMARRVFVWIPGCAHCCPRKVRHLTSSFRGKAESKHSFTCAACRAGSRYVCEREDPSEEELS